MDILQELFEYCDQVKHCRLEQRPGLWDKLLGELDAYKQIEILRKEIYG